MVRTPVLAPPFTPACDVLIRTLYTVDHNWPVNREFLWGKNGSEKTMQNVTPSMCSF